MNLIVCTILYGVIVGILPEILEAEGQQQNDQDKDKLVVAVVPQGDTSKFDAQKESLQDYFSNKTGIDVELFYPIDDTTTLASLKTGSTDIAFMSSRPALLAHEQNDGNVVAFMADLRPFNTTGGKEIQGTSYLSQYWTLKERTDINSLQDMSDKSVAFSGPLSTGGYLFPVAELVKQNLLTQGADPHEFFSNILFSGGYQQSLNALLNGEVDVAAGDDWAVFTFLTPEQQKQIKVIESFGPVPTHSVVYKTDIVPQELIVQFEKAMVDLRKEQPELLDSALFGATEYVPVDHQKHLKSLETALNITKIPHI
ncbi:MAG: phosphate/phosphite/phosphonate ABC transporter substrate-binding protein [Nitrososphaeraceae archaeon]